MLDRRSVLAGAAVSLLAGAALAQAPQPAPRQRVQGRIAKLDGSMLTVTPREGPPVEIRLADNVTVSALRRLELSDIAPNAFVGIASRPEADGELKAIQVLVFPEAMRGTGEGHYPWDQQPNAMMTNATVEASVASTSGRDLNLVFKGQTVKIRVPTDVPILTIIPAARADLVPGAAISFFATRNAEGQLTAARVTVEKDGVAPPI